MGRPGIKGERFIADQAQAGGFRMAGIDENISLHADQLKTPSFSRNSTSSTWRARLVALNQRRA